MRQIFMSIASSHRLAQLVVSQTTVREVEPRLDQHPGGLNNHTCCLSNYISLLGQGR